MFIIQIYLLFTVQTTRYSDFNDKCKYDELNLPYTAIDDEVRLLSD